MDCDSIDSSSSSSVLSDDSSVLSDDSIEDLIISGILDNVSLSAWADRWHHNRIDWEYHVEKLLHEGNFTRTYRMSYEAFCQLDELLGPNMGKYPQRCPSKNPILPTVKVALGIRWLSGSKYQDLRDLFGISQNQVYKIQDLFLDAVLSCDELELTALSKLNLERINKDFTAKSSEGVIRGCVGAIDGMLQPIRCPTVRDCNGNQRAYHSGHYNCHGLNVQAICDAHLRFTMFCVATPGKSGDAVAVKYTDLDELLDRLPEGFYILGDAAYPLSDKVLVPYTGSQRDDNSKDAFNYFLSQLRIRIEMSFGRLQIKWRLLSDSLAYGLKKIPKYYMFAQGYTIM